MIPLDDLGAPQELKELFRNDEWLQKRVMQSGYIYDNYLADLDRAWKHAEAEARRQIEASQAPTAFADCVRYALIRTSVNSIAANYVPEAVVRAIESGRWTTEQALRVAARISWAENRAKMYGAFLKTNYLSELQRDQAQQLALDTASLIEDKGIRAEILLELAPLLHEHESILQRILDAALDMSNRSSTAAEVLVALAPQLNEEQRARSLDAARSFPGWPERVRLLVALAPQLNEELCVRVLDEVESIPMEWWRTNVLTMVLVALAPQLQRASLQRALQDAFTIYDIPETYSMWARAKVLAALAPQLRKEERAFENAIDNPDLRKRAEVLAALAPHLSGEQHDRALKVALEATRAIGDPMTSIPTLAKLAPELSGEQRDRALQDALEAACAIGEPLTSITASAKLVPQLSGRQRDRALQHIFETARSLLPSQPHGILPALIPQLRKKQHDRVLRDTRNLTNLLVELASQLSGKQRDRTLQHALDAALADEDDWTRIHMVAELAPRLRRSQRDRALKIALEAALFPLVADPVQMPALLAPHLNEPLIEHAFDAALATDHEHQRAKMLVILAPHLYEPLLKSAFNAALTINGERQRVEVLAALAPKLQGEQHEQAIWHALELALVIHDDEKRAKALATLAPQLSGKRRDRILQHALKAALAIDREVGRAESLAVLAPHLSEPLLQHALTAALALSGCECAEVLIALAPRLRREQRELALQRALWIAQSEVKTGRVRLLCNLAPLLRPEERTLTLQRAFEDALALGLESNSSLSQCADALTALAPLLRGEQRDRALQRALEIALTKPGTWLHTEILCDLAPQLSGPLLQRVLHHGLALEKEKVWTRVKVLAAVAPRLSGEQRALASITPSRLPLPLTMGGHAPTRCVD